MKLSKTQKSNILEMFKMVDVKDLEIDHTDEEKVKWFRFGSYNGIQIAAEIIKAIDDEPSKKTARIID